MEEKIDVEDMISIQFRKEILSISETDVEVEYEEEGPPHSGPISCGLDLIIPENVAQFGLQT